MQRQGEAPGHLTRWVGLRLTAPPFESRPPCGRGLPDPMNCRNSTSARPSVSINWRKKKWTGLARWPRPLDGSPRRSSQRTGHLTNKKPALGPRGRVRVSTEHQALPKGTKSTFLSGSRLQNKRPSGSPGRSPESGGLCFFPRPESDRAGTKPAEEKQPRPLSCPRPVRYLSVSEGRLGQSQPPSEPGGGAEARLGQSAVRLSLPLRAAPRQSRKAPVSPGLGLGPGGAERQVRAAPVGVGSQGGAALPSLPLRGAGWGWWWSCGPLQRPLSDLRPRCRPPGGVAARPHVGVRRPTGLPSLARGQPPPAGTRGAPSALHVRMPGRVSSGAGHRRGF